MNKNMGPVTRLRRDRSRTAETPCARAAAGQGVAPKGLTSDTVPSQLDDGPITAVTMKDIAQDLGLSLVTVSKVIRNQEDVSDKTRTLVLERVKAVNYKPNLSARALATGRTRLVGLVVPDLLHTYFAQIAKSLSRTLIKKGYCLTILASEENPDLERETIDHLLAWRPDALIIASAAKDPKQIANIQKRGTPLLLIDRYFPDLVANYIGSDDEVVGALATEHLISVGCKRIAHLCGPRKSPGTGRLNGYLKALGKHGFKSSEALISAMEMVEVPSLENGAELMKRLLVHKPLPDGVFCYNDPIAIGAINAILAAGLRVPEDIAVIGSGNWYYSTELRVPLSSVDQQTELIGERAARLTLSLIESRKQVKAKTFNIQPKLVVRESTNRKRKDANTS